MKYTQFGQFANYILMVVNICYTMETTKLSISF